jgi:ABC-type transport system involved in multi-copper enzyme maturation permease subunit
MYFKLFVSGIILLGSYLIYTNPDVKRDSLLLGVGIILAGVLLTVIGMMLKEIQRDLERREEQSP